MLKKDHMKQFAFRVGALVFACIAIVLGLEISLAFANVLVTHNSSPNNVNRAHRGYTVLCVGDSFTYGTGVNKDYAYPVQLEELCGLICPQKQIKVINVGVPGANSTQMLKSLPDNLRAYSPDMVIIWAGVDNCWNLTDSNYFLFARSRNMQLLFKKIDALLLKSRTYKLLKIVKININNGMKRRAILRNGSDEVYFSKQEKQDEILSRAKVLADRNKHEKEKILGVLQEAYAVRGDTAAVINFLKMYYAWDEFSAMVKEFAHKIADKELLREINVYASVQKAPKKAYFTYNLDYQNYEKAIFDRLLDYDLQQMIKLSQKSGAQVLLLTYFSDQMERGGDNEIIRSAAVKHKLPCIDFARIFDQLLKEKPFEFYFVPDGHCNEKGYEKVAQCILPVLLD